MGCVVSQDSLAQLSLIYSIYIYILKVAIFDLPWYARSHLVHCCSLVPKTVHELFLVFTPAWAIHRCLTDRSVNISVDTYIALQHSGGCLNPLPSTLYPRSYETKRKIGDVRVPCQSTGERTIHESYQCSHVEQRPPKIPHGE